MLDVAQLVFLPATEPGDATYGAVPEQVAAYPTAKLYQVRFPSLVWYNAAARTEAIRQIAALEPGPVVLIGFSKSGLGAWNIARAIPDRIAATLIFDAPAARAELPPWGTAPFYADDAAWQEDLPLLHVTDFAAALPRTHKLILISGEGFHDEMALLARALSATELDVTFLPRPHLRHHWQSGWLEDGLAALLRGDRPADGSLEANGNLAREAKAVSGRHVRHLAPR